MPDEVVKAVNAGRVDDLKEFLGQLDVVSLLTKNVILPHFDVLADHQLSIARKNKVCNA